MSGLQNGFGNGNGVEPSSSAENTPLLHDAETNGEIQPPRKESFVKKYAVRIAIILLMVVVFVLVIAFGIKESRYSESKPSLCLTPECIHASSAILDNLSPDYKNIDPCEDFQSLVCGGWEEKHDLRPDQGDAFTGTIMAENSQTLLRHILEAPYPEESNHSSFSPMSLISTLSTPDKDNFNKLKDAYNACMDEAEIKKIGLAPLVDMLESIEAIYNVSAKKPDIASTVAYLSERGVTALVAAGAGADDTDPDSVIVEVSAPYSIGLPAKDYYADDAVVEKYETAITDVFSGIFKSDGGAGVISNAAELAHKIVKFEKDLAAASPAAADRDDVTKYYNPMSLKEADALAPSIQLSKILSLQAPKDFEIKRLIVMAPSYLVAVGNLTETTPSTTLQGYFLWKAIQGYASAVESDALISYKRFRNTLQGKDPDSAPERWRTCIAHVDDGLGWILSRFFVEKAFSEKAKLFGDQIVSDIKEQFIEKLKMTEWMDKDVQKLAIEKVHKIVQKIGYPTKSPNIMDPAALSNYYSTVPISPSQFFNNTLSMSHFSVSKQWSALGHPVDHSTWEMTVPTVNAYYNPPGNEIVFPAGIMQDPVFSVALPPYLSYGAFASVAGHELSHAFDSTGRHYDQNGNYTDWWTNDTVVEFEKRADCFVDQYANFTVPALTDGAPPLHVNGRLTLGENIADAGGISAGFSAWRQRASDENAGKSTSEALLGDLDLPGLEHFSHEQLFFVSYAGWWCGKSTRETAVQRVYTDPHAPKRARILGTMANSRDFRRSFGCAVKEPVCEMW